MVSYTVSHRGSKSSRSGYHTFVSRHRKALANPIIQQFLKDETNYHHFVQTVSFPTKQRWQQLNRSFQRFYTEIRLIDYISKTLWRYAKDFRTQKERCRYVLILDQPIDKEEGLTHKDQLTNQGPKACREKTFILNLVEQPELYQALQTLTDRQLKLLDLYFCRDLTQKEIAHDWGVSQQSISKTFHKALDHLRASLSKLRCP